MEQRHVSGCCEDFESTTELKRSELYRIFGLYQTPRLHHVLFNEEFNKRWDLMATTYYLIVPFECSISLTVHVVYFILLLYSCFISRSTAIFLPCCSNRASFHQQLLNWHIEPFLFRSRSVSLIIQLENLASCSEGYYICCSNVVFHLTTQTWLSSYRSNGVFHTSIFC